MAETGSSSVEKRQQPQAQGGSEKRQKGGCGGGCTGKIRPRTQEEYKQWLKQGNGYGRGFKPENLVWPTDEVMDFPEDLQPEYRSDYVDIFMRKNFQLLNTNGMELDDFPGEPEIAGTVPLDINTHDKEDKELVMELAKLAIKEYNEESNFHKYKLLKIEKVNNRWSSDLEYFMTVKVMNLTLGTVVETLQIHAREDLYRIKDVVSCLPKGGALPSAMEMESD